MALVTALSDSASTIFQTLAETILDVTQCDSSGLSLLTPDGGKRFYWPAIAGMWAPHVGGGTPRNFGPCGDVLDRNCTMLFRHFERRYPYLMPVVPPRKSACWFRFTSTAKPSEPYGGSCTAIAGSSIRKMSGSWARSGNLRPWRIERWHPSTTSRSKSPRAKRPKQTLRERATGLRSQDPAPDRRKSHGDLHLESLRAGLSRPMKHFSRWCSGAAKTSARPVCAGRI